MWQTGKAAVPTPTSRFLRQAALFEKKERNLAAAAALFADSVRRDPQVRHRAPRGDQGARRAAVATGLDRPGKVSLQG